MISVFDMFSIGVGPSSSHTVGPMRAACAFVQALKAKGVLDQTMRLNAHLYGSLALTGKGHGTDNAVIMGLMGELPQTVDPEHIAKHMNEVQESHSLNLLGEHRIHFDMKTDMLWHKQEVLPYHSNGMCFKAFNAQGQCLHESIQYSIGGGFIVDNEQLQEHEDPLDFDCPYPFNSAAELLALCHKHHLTIAQLMFDNECSLRSEAEVREGLLNIWSVMDTSIDRGCQRENGVLPGGLNITLRAPKLYAKLKQRHTETGVAKDMDWLSLFAIAVNEENAAGKRIVTAPTNGAAGIIPAVLKYFKMFYKEVTEQHIMDYLLTAAAIGILYKKNASISAAEVGCQGEVGVACSMAAGALAAIMGADVAQIENAAEMGMEHHLGLTCDPIGGLVQIPCIERNAMGSVQAVNSARLAILGDGQHHVSLDQVIKTMFETGRDMSAKYKETSLGGLAVNQPAC